LLCDRFGGFEIERVDTVYSMHDKNRGKKAGELIIAGPFKPSASVGYDPNKGGK
jgi:hypothetical protein